MKIGRILDEEHGAFGLEYDTTRGDKNTMRLDALTYEKAVREAKSFLGIQEDDLDGDGTLWEIV
jgi:hypothetical protein